MTDLENRIVAVVATTAMGKKELTDYIALEGWVNVSIVIGQLFDRGVLEFNSSNKVVLA